MKSLQSYLRTLLKRNEITKDEFDMIRPKNAKPARAHGLPKIHKEFSNIPKFRPIIDTTGTTHCLVGKYLASLLNPLTINEYSLKDSFDAANRIKCIPQNLFENGYQYISFDVESLFSNVPIKRTVDIILKRIYEDKLVSTNLRKRTLKKLILDTCTKTAFSFNNKLYQQKDGVSMGSSLGPVLANIIMAELEDVVIKPLITNGTIKFYTRFVDDTLLVIKPENVKKVHNALNKFDKNLRFTVDMFKDKVPHFLDLELSPDGTSIFRKNTNTGLYVNFTSFVPWTYRISWIKSLVTRASRICAPNKLSSEISTIKNLLHGMISLNQLSIQ